MPFRKIPTNIFNSRFSFSAFSFLEFLIIPLKQKIKIFAIRRILSGENMLLKLRVELLNEVIRTLIFQLVILKSL